MPSISSPSTHPARAPLDLPNRSLAVKLFAVVAGILLLSLSSYITIPMVPVPMTLQTLVVTLIGALYGWRLGVLTIVAWLIAGALGLPVLANGGAGVAKFMGPTAGYLFAFPLAAATVAWLVARGWNGAHMVRAFAAMLLGTVVCLVFGGGWLAYTIGTEKAWLNGVLPFLAGGVIKSLVGAAVLKALAFRPQSVAVA